VDLNLHNRSKDALAGVFAVRVEKNNIELASLGTMPGGATMAASTVALFTSKLPLKEGVSKAKTAVAEELVKAGLYPKEARAMVNTWEHSYFRTEGLRMLYILPRANVDQTIPIQIQPAPTELARVMVGRVEVLTPAKERSIEKAVAELSAPSPFNKMAALAELDKLGRFQEPALHRVAAMTKSQDVRAQGEILIAKTATRQDEE
jgi:hypothetical protein